MKYILIALIFIAVALMGVLFEDLKHIARLNACANQPYDHMSYECREIIDAVPY